ncbi:MAG: Ig-like domain-containing protein [Gemmatimonadota bacterium]|nr:Ig-like domain-containing protein [Gemmatimonadota bacterium]
MRTGPAVAAALLAAAPLIGCGNPEPPPGVGPDARPPSVLERFPADGAVVPELRRKAILRFDEPIQSPRNLERQLQFSPAWDWDFSAGTNGFEARPEGGWRRDVVYRIVVPAGISDLLRNRTTRPVEWTFSTGQGEIPRARIEGNMFDRVTVRPARGARLLFLPPDSTPYTTLSDSAGGYSMRGLPPATYEVLGFVDQNANGRLDRLFEAWDSATAVLADSATLAVVELWLVPPDTTPPVLVAAVARDSGTVVLEFDDPIDPEASLETGAVTILAADGSPGPAVASLAVGEPVVDEAVGEGAEGEEPEAGDAPGAEEEAPADGDGRGDEAEPAADGDAPGAEEEAPGEERAPVEAEADAEAPAADSVAAAARPVPPAADRGPPAPTPRAEPLRRPDSRPVPSTRITARLDGPLAPGPYRVRAAGLPNLRGLRGGGDTTFVYEPPPPPPPPELPEPDSMEAPAPDGRSPDAAPPAGAPPPEEGA